MNTRAFWGIIVVAGLLTSGLHRADAQTLRAVQPLAGYSCMSLNLTQEQMMDFNAVPPVLATPRANAPKIGDTSSVVIVADPVRAENGYVSILMLNGRPGWVQASKLKPYHSVSNPSARCVPSMMSNGKPGFAFPQ